MDAAEIKSTIALCVSGLSLGISTWVASRDRARIKVKSNYVGSLHDVTFNRRQPAYIFVTLSNEGRRPVVMRGIDYEFTNKARRFDAINGPSGTALTLNENDSHQIEIKDHDCFMGNQMLTNVSLTDSLERRYKIKGIKKHIRKLIESEGSFAASTAGAAPKAPDLNPNNKLK